MFDGPSTIRVTLGEIPLYFFNVTDEGNITIAVKGLQTGTYVLHGNNVITFPWIPQPFNTSVTFVATDSLNVTSTLSPRVEMCACQNEGKCTLDGILGFSDSTVIMRCECPQGEKLMYTR